MENSCHDENMRKFSQTSNTPLVHVQISKEIGFYGTSGICLKILQGDYNAPPDTDNYTSAYLKHIRRSPKFIEPPQAIMPTKIFQEEWSNIKERTSAGISCLHFGHIKACSQLPFISDFEASLPHTHYTTIYAPDDWKNA